MLCENQNAPLYNTVDLPDYLFVAARDKNAVSIQAKALPEFFGLIDRDFLGSAEIRQQNSNLNVLDYYAIESYLYHPSNIAELAPKGFDEAHYGNLIQTILRSVRDRLLVRLEKTRNSYEIIKTSAKNRKMRRSKRSPRRRHRMISKPFILLSI